MASSAAPVRHVVLKCEVIARRELGEPRRKGKELGFRCPIHGKDENPSLDVNPDKNKWICRVCNVGGGAWSLAAFIAGIDPNNKESVKAWLRERGYLPDSASVQPQATRTYEYTDEEGRELYHVVRYEPKAFKYRRRGQHDDWIWNLDGVPRVPYNLPEVKLAAEVWIVEGEKDADNLKRWKLTATTNPMGVGKWRDEYNEWFRGKAVRIIPDNDGPGEDHVRDVARRLTGIAREVSIVKLPDLPPKGDFSDWRDAGHTLQELLDLRSSSVTVPPEDLFTAPHRAEVAPAVTDRPATKSVPWPAALSQDAFYGLAGEWCRIVEPHSEADTPAHLVQFLLGFGNAIGRSAYLRIAATEHRCNLFAVLVGATGKSRKGTSWGQDRFVLNSLDEHWLEKCESSGLSTGEGLIHSVRDPRPAPASSGRSQRRKSDPEDKGDPGVTDKRLLVVESEFSKVLKVSERENSTLSANIRDAWDGRPLRIMVKRDALQATGAHISILGHVTIHELRRRLTEEAISNGFANRFLFVCAQRVQYLPDGGKLHTIDLQPFLTKLQRAYQSARCERQVWFDDEAFEIYSARYRALSEGQPGLFGSVTARAEAHVLRLSLLEAVLDLSSTIRVDHLRAALAIWKYCEDSARYIFGTATGDPLADNILEILRAHRDEGKTRSELSAEFSRKKTAAELDLALKRLADLGQARRTEETTDGRPAERWFPI